MAAITFPITKAGDSPAIGRVSMKRTAMSSCTPFGTSISGLPNGRRLIVSIPKTHHDKAASRSPKLHLTNANIASVIRISRLGLRPMAGLLLLTFKCKLCFSLSFFQPNYLKLLKHIIATYLLAHAYCRA